MASCRSVILRAGTLAVVATVFCVWLVAPVRAQTPTPMPLCVGDCNGNKTVDISELITCVNIALGTDPLSVCPACTSGTMVVISDLITAVNNDLNGCNATPPPTSATSPTPTATPPGTSCPLMPGKYTITSEEGGVLTVSSLSSFAFPAGGTIIADVGQPDTNCVHKVVVPFPSPVGFTAPVFCVPALGFTVSVTQTGCGIGEIDSNGGSDFTVSELGDTSYDSSKDSAATSVCHITQASCPMQGPAPDSSILVRVKVGDGQPDVCTPPATANALIAVPVFTLTWLEKANPGQCPAKDGMYNPGTDTLVSQFPQTLDFTTDTTTAAFQDLDMDHCFISGAGPAAGFSNSGTCMDIGKLNQQTKVCKTGTCTTGGAACSTDIDCKNNTGPCNPVFCAADADCGSKGPCQSGQCSFSVAGCAADADCGKFGPCRQPVGAIVATTAAAGTIGSSGVPLYDLAYTTTLPNSITGPEMALGATCATPPLINFTGSVDRCITGP
jgi:hypothetical protein